MQGLRGGCTKKPLIENGFLYIHAFYTLGTQCAEEIYYIDLISSKLPPVQWHGHWLFSAVFLQCFECPQAPQSLHLLSPSSDQAACMFLPDLAFSGSFLAYQICSLSLSWKIHG